MVGHVALVHGVGVRILVRELDAIKYNRPSGLKIFVDEHSFGYSIMAVRRTVNPLGSGSSPDIRAKLR